MEARATPVAPQVHVTVRTFTQRFSATPRGARLARRLAVLELDEWGHLYGCVLSDTAGAIVAELAANAATHGRVPGRDFELRLALLRGVGGGGALRIEVADTRGEAWPPGPGGVGCPGVDAEGGRGLLIVDALADRWVVLDRVPVGKVVRAEVGLGSGEW
jgi:anti-sigma regulatory factor (Ser/Thr protein kinase)